jgi:hypothetical protein
MAGRADRGGQNASRRLFPEDSCVRGQIVVAVQHADPMRSGRLGLRTQILEKPRLRFGSMKEPEDAQSPPPP